MFPKSIDSLSRKRQSPNTAPPCNPGHGCTTLSLSFLMCEMSRSLPVLFKATETSGLGPALKTRWRSYWAYGPPDGLRRRDEQTQAPKNIKPLTTHRPSTRAEHSLAHLILTSPCQSWHWHCHTHFTNRETKAQSNPFPIIMHSKQVAGPGFKPKSIQLQRPGYFHSLYAMTIC